MKLVAWTFFYLSPLLSVASSQSESDTSSCLPPVSPKGLSVHEDGSLYVLDTAHGLQEYSTLDGAFAGTLTDETKAEGGVQVVGDTIFVSAASNSGGTVEKFDLAGTLLETFPSSSSSGEELTAGGYDVAVSADGNVYVSNYLSDGVEVYDGATGEHLMQVLGDNRALGIAFGPDDMLYAAINGDDEVRRFTTSSDGNLTLVDAFINGGSGSRTRSGPWGVTVNQDDYLVYVCWAGSQELTEYSQSGAELRWWFPGQSTSATVAGEDDDSSGGAGSALSPLYVAVDGGGDVYVSAQVEDGGDADVFKYDGATGDEVGLLSSCWEVSAANSTETPQPSAAPSGSLAPLTTAPSGSPAPSGTAPSGSPAPSTGSVAPATTSSMSSRAVSSETPSPSSVSTSDGSTTSPAVTATPAGETASPATAGGEASSTNGAGRGGAVIPGFAFFVAFQVLMVVKMSGVASSIVG